MRKLFYLLVLFTLFSCEEEVIEEDRNSGDWEIIITNGENKYIIAKHGYDEKLYCDNDICKFVVYDLFDKRTGNGKPDYSYVWITQYDKPYGNEIKKKKLTPEDNIFVCE